MFESVEKLREAYKALINSKHGPYITKIRHELDENLLKIFIDMGVKGNTATSEYMPFVG